MIDALLQCGIELVERGYVPDRLTRSVIRRLCADRLNDLSPSRAGDTMQAEQQFLNSLGEGPIALVPERANQQHYELPPQFFGQMLGPRRKYSCCYFPQENSTLAEAEDAALSLTCEHAEIRDGQQILELGCGWGSLSLWMAERYPRSRITAVSNAASQRHYIEAIATQRKFDNLRIVTADMNDFDADRRSFDRVVSIEMFEHMRNYRELLLRIGRWIKPDGRLFVHIFCHRQLIYPFETEGSANWMGRHFFTGGMMPHADLLNSFRESFEMTNQWNWEGTHYQRTAEAWLQNLDSRKREATEILQSTYGFHEGLKWFHRWRMFLLAVSELFGYAKGLEWYVTHCLLQPTSSAENSIGFHE